MADVFFVQVMPPAQVLELVTRCYKVQTTEARVMVVDDPQILTFIQNLLAPWGIADNSRRSKTILGHLTEFSPDFTDFRCKMPALNGIERQVVRNDPLWSELPVLHCPCRSWYCDQIFVAGADDCACCGTETSHPIFNRLERTQLLRANGWNWCPNRSS